MQQPQGLFAPQIKMGIPGIAPAGQNPMNGGMNGGMAPAQPTTSFDQAPPSPTAHTKLGIQEHYDKASSVCGHIDDLVAALTELYEDNARWKSKYISTKKIHFSKFFGASATMLLGSCFREWRSWTFEQSAARQYDALRLEQEIAEKEWNLKLENQEREHEKRLLALESTHKLAIAELSEQINARNSQISKLQSERDNVTNKGEKSYKVLQSLKNQLDALDEDDLVANADMQNMNQLSGTNFDFLKNKLHDLLNQVDPKYVPPLGSISLIPAANGYH